jgi:hypothetical protein
MQYVSNCTQRFTGQVGKSISAQASHGTVRESLPSYGSCYTNLISLQIVANDKTSLDILT